MYVGRFAPTTSGPLHLGSLLAAVASYLDARAHAGHWLLRLDDIDTPRSSPSAVTCILETLQAHGLKWDGEISRQSDHVPAYEQAIAKLHELGLLFYCTCSRRQRRENSIYPDICRDRRSPTPHTPAAIKVQVPDMPLGFDDRVQGRIEGNLAKSPGDFTVMRKEGIVSYPLAVVIDDIATGVTDVVRGADLCELTLTQIYLSNLIELPQPSYAHIPVLNQRRQIKLSKRDKAVEVDNRYPKQNLTMTMHMLGLEPPTTNDVQELLAWGVEHWHMSQVPNNRHVTDFISI